MAAWPSESAWRWRWHTAPRLLVADEPTAGLDVTIQRQVLDLMQRLTRETGTAQLVVTADLGIAAQYCDTVVSNARGADR